MRSSSSAHDLEVSQSPFRAAFDRARVEAQGAAGQPHQSIDREHEANRSVFEYRLEKRRGKRSADEADWNALGRRGWELVGLTDKHAAFKRRVPFDLSR